MEPTLHHMYVIQVMCLMLTLSAISKSIFPMFRGLERGADIDHFFTHDMDSLLIKPPMLFNGPIETPTLPKNITNKS